MILTVTLNPAVDKTCRINKFIPGQVNRLEGINSIAGGKGVNVAKVLRQFGYPVKALGFAGGYTGSMIEAVLKGMGAECCFTHIVQDTRVNTNILADDGQVTELLEPGPVISESELQQFMEEYGRQLREGDLVVLSGSIPMGVPTDIYATLTFMAKEKNCKVFLDTSSEALEKGVAALPDLIKPNKKELEYLVGRRLDEKEEVIREAGKLVKTGIQKVIISLGEEGLLYVDEQSVWQQDTYKVKTVNTVACGDTVVASYCMSELEKTDPAQAIKKAAAMAAANASTAVSAEIPIQLYQKLLG